MPLSVATTEICPTIDRAIVLLRQMGTRGYPQGLRAWKLKSRLTQGVPSRRIECPAGVVFRSQLYRPNGLYVLVVRTPIKAC
jgi:hypothetical protein